MDPHSWTLVGATNHASGSLVARDIERTNLFVVPAVLRKRTPLSGNGRDTLGIRVLWPTGEERFSVRLGEQEMSFEDGAQILALISTETSTARGCTNGYAQLEAVQIAPGVWVPHLPRP